MNEERESGSAHSGMLYHGHVYAKDSLPRAFLGANRSSFLPCTIGYDSE